MNQHRRMTGRSPDPESVSSGKLIFPCQDSAESKEEKQQVLLKGALIFFLKRGRGHVFVLQNWPGVLGVKD